MKPPEWAQRADRELNRVFEFIVWGFIQLGHGLAWIWNQTPGQWEWWWRALLLVAVFAIGSRLIGILVRRLWAALWGIPKILSLIHI